MLERNAPWVYHDTPAAIDLSEIAKPHACRMPHLCTAREASSKDKRKTPGYWLVEAYAEPSAGLLAMTVVALAAARPESWRTALIRRGRSRLVEADFLSYRILRGIAHLLQREPLL